MQEVEDTFAVVEISIDLLLWPDQIYNRIAFDGIKSLPIPNDARAVPD